MNLSRTQLIQRMFIGATTVLALGTGLSGQTAQAQEVDHNGLGVFAMTKSYTGKFDGPSSKFSGTGTGGGVSYQLQFDSPNWKMMPFAYILAGTAELELYDNKLKANDFNNTGVGLDFRYMADMGAYVGLSLTSAQMTLNAKQVTAPTGPGTISIPSAKINESAVHIGLNLGWEGGGLTVGLNTDFPAKYGDGLEVSSVGANVGWRF
ncbi:MAG: hypothetical protein OEW12_01775 [Deltaproteobacteria bacterium]|nr:hypothetical protein [Deltaproteobacteria bacterium]